MTNREMINYLREELNENRRIVIYLNVLVAKMESPEDVIIIRKEINRLSNYIEETKIEFYRLLDKELNRESENDK